MKKVNYKGRREKRKVSKCRDVCRSYSKIQSAMVDILEKDNDVVSFECNVFILEVYTINVSEAVQLTKAGLANLKVFSKNQLITYN